MMLNTLGMADVAGINCASAPIVLSRPNARSVSGSTQNQTNQTY